MLSEMCVCVCEKETMNLKEGGTWLCGKGWREERGGENNRSKESNAPVLGVQHSRMNTNASFSALFIKATLKRRTNSSRKTMKRKW